MIKVYEWTFDILDESSLIYRYINIAKIFIWPISNHIETSIPPTPLRFEMSSHLLTTAEVGDMLICSSTAIYAQGTQN